MKPSRLNRSVCRGFTLIELLVAMTVLCVLLSLLFSTLWFCIRSWDTAERHRDATHTLALVQDTLARQLRQARPLLQTDSAGQRVIAFAGDTRRLSYIAPLSRRDSALYLNTVYLTESTDGYTLRLQYLPWRPDLDLDAVTAHPATPDNSVELLSGIEALAIAYFGAPDAGGRPAWRTHWNQSRSLPERIRIHISTAAAGAHDWPDLMVCLDGGSECLIPDIQRPDVHLVARGERRHDS